MPKSANQKLKLLYLSKILHEKTDENHTLTVRQIIAELDQLGIKAERKTIYDDMEALRLFGVDIVCRKSKTYDYFVSQRDFELPELKLLVDVISSTKFLTEKKASMLITKLQALTSKYEAKELHRHVYVYQRVKATNEKIFYSTDVIHKAIHEKKQITFKYFDWGLDKKIHYREGVRCVSPYGLVWNNEKYYLIAYYDKYDRVSHFRVDKMDEVSIVEHEIVSPPENFTLKDYGDRFFSMFSGERKHVTMRFDNRLINVVYDKFGFDTTVTLVDENSFIISIEVEVSPAFFAWIFQFGALVKILEPACVQEQMHQQLKSLEEIYR